MRHTVGTQLPAGEWLAVLEGVEDPNIESLELAFISCGNNQMMHPRSGSDRPRRWA